MIRSEVELEPSHEYPGPAYACTLSVLGLFGVMDSKVFCSFVSIYMGIRGLPYHNFGVHVAGPKCPHTEYVS